MPSADQVARRLLVKSDVRIGEPRGGGQTPTTDILMLIHSTADIAVAGIVYSSADGVTFRCYRSFGSAASPTAIDGSSQQNNLGATFATLRGYAYNGSTWVNAASVRMTAVEAWSTSVNGSAVQLRNILTGSTVENSRWALGGAGAFGPTTQFDNTYDLGSTAGRVRTVYATAINIGADSTAGGSFEVFVANTTTIPGANPSGGVVLYASSGALIARGSSGTLTTIAPA